MVMEKDGQSHGVFLRNSNAMGEIVTPTRGNAYLTVYLEQRGSERYVHLPVDNPIALSSSRPQSSDFLLLRIDRESTSLTATVCPFPSPRETRLTSGLSIFSPFFFQR